MTAEHQMNSVERVARAIYAEMQEQAQLHVTVFELLPTYDTDDDDVRKACLAVARAAISAMTAPADVSEGDCCPPHCCCCDHYEPCCDCGQVMPSRACIGEKCRCGAPASKKVGEEILFDDPNPARHNLTAYVCARHYAELMGPMGAKQVGIARKDQQ